MTKEEKDLLLKDLCSRLPYGVKVQIKKNKIVVLDSICDDDGYYFNFIGEDKEGYMLDEVKPYLFPLSSIPEELKEEYQCLLDNQYSFDANGNIFTLQDFYCKYHLDYRGLIPMGLANDATGLNIYLL